MADQARCEALIKEDLGLYIDFSRQRMTQDTIKKLMDLAAAADLRGKIDAMYAGDHINSTEDRSGARTLGAAAVAAAAALARCPSCCTISLALLLLILCTRTNFCSPACLPDAQLTPRCVCVCVCRSAAHCHTCAA